eukprot:scaffold3014_cov116-Cylindrotheca_fusiformis.AAC.2
MGSTTMRSVISLLARRGNRIARNCHKNTSCSPRWCITSHPEPQSFFIRLEAGRVKRSYSSSSSYPFSSRVGYLDSLYHTLLLNSNERALLDEQRQLTETARQLAGQVGGSKVTELLHNTSSLNFLQELNLQSTFSVVVAGEFNAGKSTLINALLGQQLLESGALPTTDSIHIIANSVDENAQQHQQQQLLQQQQTESNRQLPMGVALHLVRDMPLLKDVTLIDTPGTNSAWMDHTARTLRLLPSADLILFVTSADRPFSDSERSLIKSIQAYRKSIVVLINKMDILMDDETAKTKITEFVTDHASELLGARPIVIPISSRPALSAKLAMRQLNNDASGGDDGVMDEVAATEAWKESNFASLESFLRDSLTTQTRIRSKLTSPIAVAESLMVACLETLRKEKNDLQADMSTLNILKSQLQGWQSELDRDLTTAKMNMTKLLDSEGGRVEMLLSRMNWFQYYLWAQNQSQFNVEWQETKRQPYLAEEDKAIWKQIYWNKGALTSFLSLYFTSLFTSDSVASRGRAQGQVVTEYLGNRPAMKNQSLIGSVTSTSRFEDTRQNLGKQMSEAVQTTLEGTKDDVKDRDGIFQTLRQLAMASAGMNIAAAGSAAVSLLGMPLVDPLTGMVVASGLLVGGNAILFVGSSKLSKTYKSQWSRRAHDLGSALDVIYSKELDKVSRRIFDGVAPYTRFVESEQVRIDKLQDECEGVATAARSLRNKIGKL